MSAILKDPLFTVRTMHPADLENVMVVEEGAYTHPWTHGIFRDCLRVGYSCWVCELGGQLIGHAVMSVAVGEAHVLNLCIGTDWQGRGLGRKLLRRMLRVARENKADTVFLEVRISNKSAIGLYESEGFCEIAIRRNYYPVALGHQEDAVVYAKTLI